MVLLTVFQPHLLLLTGAGAAVKAAFGVPGLCWKDSPGEAGLGCQYDSVEARLVLQDLMGTAGLG